MGPSDSNNLVPYCKNNATISVMLYNLVYKQFLFYRSIQKQDETVNLGCQTSSPFTRVQGNTVMTSYVCYLLSSTEQTNIVIFKF